MNRHEENTAETTCHNLKPRTRVGKPAAKTLNAPNYANTARANAQAKKPGCRRLGDRELVAHARVHIREGAPRMVYQ